MELVKVQNGNEWPVNNEAKNEGGLKGTNAPYLTPVFLIKKTSLNQDEKFFIIKFAFHIQKMYFRFIDMISFI